MKPRLKKELRYKSFRLQRSLPRDWSANLPPPYRLGVISWQFGRQHYRALHFWLLVVSVSCWWLFWQTPPSLDLEASQVLLAKQYGSGVVGYLQQSLNLVTGAWSNFFDQLIANLGSFILLNLLASLALWWLLRQRQAQQTLRVRDAFYFGPAQFVPYLILALLLSLQLLPGLILADFGANLRASGILQTTGEQTAALAVILAVFGFGLYWLMAGLFSLIIVSPLPGIRPLSAWRTSLNLAHRRRSLIGLHLLLAGVTLGLLSSLLLVALGLVNPELRPSFNPASLLVFSARPACIHFLFISAFN